MKCKACKSKIDSRYDDVCPSCGWNYKAARAARQAYKVVDPATAADCRKQLMAMPWRVAAGHWLRAKLREYRLCLKSVNDPLLNRAARLHATIAYRKAARELHGRILTGWGDFCTIYDFDVNDDAVRLLVRTLADPNKCSKGWFYDAVLAVRYSRTHNGIIGQLEEQGYVPSYDDIRIAVRAYRRHNYTPYDELLADGWDRDDARAAIRWL